MITGDSSETMRFGSIEVTSTQLTTMHRADLVALLMDSGASRITAERIVEVHRGGSVGRARAHGGSRGAPGGSR